MMTHTSSAFTISSWNVDQRIQRQQHLTGRNFHPYKIPRQQQQQQLFSMKSKPGDTAAKVEAQRQEIKLPSTTSDELPLLYNNENDVQFGFEKDVSTSAAVEMELGKDESGDLLWRGVVVVLCALWASNFAAGKLVLGVDGVDSSLYAVSRFGLAALALVPGSIAAVRNGAIDWATARGAAVCGSWVAFGYLGQTLGLLTTTASRSCVICSMHCVFVAIIAELTRISRLSSEDESSSFDLKRLIPAAVAVLGVSIVELKGAGGAPTIGDALSFAQPIGFGLGYVQLEELMHKKPEAALPVSAIKLIVVAFFSFLMFQVSPMLIDHQIFTGFRLPDFTPVLSSNLALGGILYTALITTALALWVESIAFKHVPATDASIILTTEPLFAALAGAITLGETFGISDYVGASLIIGACVVAILMDDESKDEVKSIEDAI